MTDCNDIPSQIYPIVLKLPAAICLGRTEADSATGNGVCLNSFANTAASPPAILIGWPFGEECARCFRSC